MPSPTPTRRTKPIGPFISPSCSNHSGRSTCRTKSGLASQRPPPSRQLYETSASPPVEPCSSTMPLRMLRAPAFAGCEPWKLRHQRISSGHLRICSRIIAVESGRALGSPKKCTTLQSRDVEGCNPMMSGQERRVPIRRKLPPVRDPRG